MIPDFNTGKLSMESIEEMLSKLKPPEFPKIPPSGTASFILEIGAQKVTFVKNDMMLEGFVILSPELYEKIYDHFKKLSQDEQHDLNRNNS